MKLFIIDIANLKKNEIDLTGALSIEIELDNGDRFGISLSPADYLDIHSTGDRFRLQIEPRAANAVFIRTAD